MFYLLLLFVSFSSFGEGCKNLFEPKRTPSALVIGNGAFGLSFSQVISDQFKEVIVLGRNKKDTADIQKSRTSKKLPEVVLSENIHVHSDWSAVSNSKIDVLVIALPFKQISQFISKNYPPLLQIIRKNKRIKLIFLSKGFSVSSNGDILFVEDLFINQFQPFLKKDQLYVLSGPSFALEMAQNETTLVNLAGFNKEQLQKLKDLIETKFFKVETTTDMKGTAYGGAVKNIMAILASMVKGLELPQNTQATLILKGNEELIRIGTKLGVNKETYLGPAYFGDLILSLSQTSRNFHLGFAIGQGTNLKNFLDQNPSLSIEGLNTIKELYQYTKNKDYPLINTLYSVLYQDHPPYNLLSAIWR